MVVSCAHRDEKGPCSNATKKGHKYCRLHLPTQETSKPAHSTETQTSYTAAPQAAAPQESPSRRQPEQSQSTVTISTFTPITATVPLITIPNAHYEALVAERQGLMAQNQKLLQDNRSLQSELTQLQSNFHEVHTRLTERDNERQGFTRTIAELTETIAELRKENAALQKENKELRERVEQLSGQVGTLSDQVQTLQQTISKQQSQVQMLEETVDRQQSLLRLGGCISLLDQAFAKTYRVKLKQRPPTNFFLAEFFDPDNREVSLPEELALWDAFVKTRPDLQDPAIQELFREIKDGRNQAAHPPVRNMTQAQVEAALARCFPSRPPEVLAKFCALLFTV